MMPRADPSAPSPRSTTVRARGLAHRDRPLGDPRRFAIATGIDREVGKAGEAGSGLEGRRAAVEPFDRPLDQADPTSEVTGQVDRPGQPFLQARQTQRITGGVHSGDRQPCSLAATERLIGGQQRPEVS